MSAAGPKKPPPEMTLGELCLSFNRALTEAEKELVGEPSVRVPDYDREPGCDCPRSELEIGGRGHYSDCERDRGEATPRVPSAEMQRSTCRICGDLSLYGIHPGRCEKIETDRLRAEALKMPCSYCERNKAERGGPSHMGSVRCESGSLAAGGYNAHCTCDTCF